LSDILHAHFVFKSTPVYKVMRYYARSPGECLHFTSHLS